MSRSRYPQLLIALFAVLQLSACGQSAVTDSGITTFTQVTGKVIVSVTDSTTRRPIANAIVSVFDSYGRQVGPWVTTGADGNAVFTNLPAGSNYLVRARGDAANYADGATTQPAHSTPHSHPSHS